MPLLDTGKRPIATLWVTSHDKSLVFNPTDARVMEQLALQLVLAIKLRRKQSLIVRLGETSHDNEMLVQEVRHRVKNMIQMTSGFLQLQQRAARSIEAKIVLREAQSRLLVLSNVYEALLEPDADQRMVDVGSLVERLLLALRDTSVNGSKINFMPTAISCSLAWGAPFLWG